MKKLSILFVFICLLSCDKKVDPDVQTLVLSDSYSNNLDDRAKAQKMAASELFKFYNSSNKDSYIYEAITRWGSGDFVVSYCPSKELLSTGVEICSGWSGQYKQVSANQLDSLGKLEVPISKYDTLLVKESNWDSSIQKSNHKCAN